LPERTRSFRQGANPKNAIHLIMYQIIMEGNNDGMTSMQSLGVSNFIILKSYSNLSLFAPFHFISTYVLQRDELLE
jgi:hypothetical protein